MPNGTGVVRPYTFVDVLMTINDQVNQVAQQASGSVTGISVVAEDDEPSVTMADNAYGAPVASPLTWGGTVWGSGSYA